MHMSDGLISTPVAAVAAVAAAALIGVAGFKVKKVHVPALCRLRVCWEHLCLLRRWSISAYPAQVLPAI